MGEGKSRRGNAIHLILKLTIIIIIIIIYSRERRERSNRENVGGPEKGLGVVGSIDR